MHSSRVRAILLMVGLAAQAFSQTVPTSTGATDDPYKPLALYDGAWNLVGAAGPDGKKPDAVHIENTCAKTGKFYVCEQKVNGKAGALLAFLPVSVEGGEFKYRLTTVIIDQKDALTSEVKIRGDHWEYSGMSHEKDGDSYWRTDNDFSGPNAIHFTILSSTDGKKWTKTREGDEQREKK